MHRLRSIKCMNMVRSALLVDDGIRPGMGGGVVVKEAHFDHVVGKLLVIVGLNNDGDFYCK